jgi:hypothetical protein
MNITLCQQMSQYFTPEQQALDNNRGGSSLEYTTKLRKELPALFKKYNIQSIFDAGCNDCSWMSIILDNFKYLGGDISRPMITDLQSRYPQLDVSLHDVTTDPLPLVDLLFVRDVTIHLNYADKRQVIANWLSSSIPYIMITHDEFKDNVDFEYADGFPFAFVNWEKDPWNFPKPVECIYEIHNSMALWHRDQICPLFE